MSHYIYMLFDMYIVGRAPSGLFAPHYERTSHEHREHRQREHTDDAPTRRPTADRSATGFAPSTPSSPASSPQHSRARASRRRDWMLLNVVSGDVDAPGFAERLARKGKRLRGLEQRGWVEEPATAPGSSPTRARAAKERLGAVVDGIRSRVAGAVSPEDFATTLASLEAIARELGWDETTACGRGAASAAAWDAASAAARLRSRRSRLRLRPGHRATTSARPTGHPGCARHTASGRRTTRCRRPTATSHDEHHGHGRRPPRATTATTRSRRTVTHGHARSPRRRDAPTSAASTAGFGRGAGPPPRRAGSTAAPAA